MSMRASKNISKQIGPLLGFKDMSKPAEERIRLAALQCFMMYGIPVPLREIAQVAESNEAVALHYYGSHDGLVEIYIKKLFEEEEEYWREKENEHPNNPEAQLRAWIRGVELQGSDSFAEGCQLARASAVLYRWNGSPLLTEVRTARKRERHRIGLLCRKAGFDDPSSLADKLVLLVDGARSDSYCFGHRGPYSKLCEAAGDLMAAHRGGLKPTSPVD